jgi:TOTE conflict system, Archaeo-Eukaryotic Primase domain/Primase C terminal 1 (PriCT-1)
VTREVTPTFLSWLVGNRSAHANQREDGSYEPVRRFTVGGSWGALFDNHLAGLVTVGTYVNEGDQARTLVFDIDSGSREETRLVAETLMDYGIDARYIGIEESGRKGFHVWVAVEDYVPAKDLRRLGRAVLADTGLDMEVFPKQDTARDLGSLVKLPGGVHRVSGKRSTMLKLMERLPVAVLNDVLLKVPEVRATGTGGGIAKPFVCMHNIQEGVTEGSRNNSLFHLAVMLRRHGLTEENVAAVVRNANSRANPPLDDSEIVSLLDSSMNSGPLCNQLPPSMGCGGDCILNRTPGLFTRPGSLRYAAEGEYAVVQVGEKEGKQVPLVHPDLRQAHGVLTAEDDRPRRAEGDSA